MATIPERDPEHGAEMQRRILEEFGIGLGSAWGISEGGFRAEQTEGSDGVAYITLVAPTNREQIDRILAP